MRILHIITNTDLGGAQRVVIDLANMSITEGHTVAVASMPNGPMWDSLSKEVLQYKLPHMVKQIKPVKEIPCLFEIRKTIKHFKPDIIHLHSSKAAALARFVCPIKLKKRIVYTVHGFDTIRIRNRFFLPLEKILQNFCGAIVPVSEYDEKNLAAEGITKNIHLIHNGVQSPNIYPENLLPTQLKSAIESNKKIIMTIARIALPKRIDLFCETAKQFPSEKFAFFWIGSPTDSTLNSQLSEYQKNTSAFFLGEIPDASRLLHYADLFVLFSDYEGLPITILESLAVSKPIVATNVGGISELVDNSNGFLIATKDLCNNKLKDEEIVTSATDAISKTLENKEKYAAMCCASIKKYNESFALYVMLQSYFALYEHLFIQK